MKQANCQWYNVQIYYSDEDQDALILNCIGPLFQSLSMLVNRPFFVRHWLRGPHIRLRFFTTDQIFTDLVKPAIEKQVGAYLHDNPSQISLDGEQLRAAYEKLARDEQETGPVLPLYPNNSIQYLPYDRRLHVLGSEVLAEVIERFYVETTDLAFKMLETVSQGNSRLTLSLDLMCATAHSYATHITRGFLSYRSHAEGFLMGVTDPDRIRNVFENKYREQAAFLAERLGQVLATLDQQEESVPFVLTWVDLMAHYWNYAEPLIEAGTLNMMPNVSEKFPSSSEIHRQALSKSIFHRLFYENRAVREALYQDSWFQTYRLMLNLLYLHMARLGVKAFERFMLCHFIANTVEQVFSISANDLISRRPPDETPALPNQGEHQIRQG